MVRTASTMLPLGFRLPEFTLPDVLSGEDVSSTHLSGAPALLVVFLCRHCPYVKHIRRGLADFAREYGERGLAIAGICSNDLETYPQDGPDGMREEATEAGYTFPYLFDESQDVARAFGAACTPDFFLFDGDRRLVYRGQFDGSRPGNGVPVTGEDLRAAADAVLAGHRPAADQRASIGCSIKWKRGSGPAPTS